MVKRGGPKNKGVREEEEARVIRGNQGGNGIPGKRSKSLAAAGICQSTCEEVSVRA